MGRGFTSPRFGCITTFRPYPLNANSSCAYNVDQTVSSAPDEDYYASYAPTHPSALKRAVFLCAGNGRSTPNRTEINGCGNHCFTIKLYPCKRTTPPVARRDKFSFHPEGLSLHRLDLSDHAYLGAGAGRPIVCSNAELHHNVCKSIALSSWQLVFATRFELALYPHKGLRTLCENRFTIKLHKRVWCFKHLPLLKTPFEYAFADVG